MTNAKKSALDKALEELQAQQEKVTLRYLIIKKTMNRADHIGAVDALGPQEDWTELDHKIVAAKKVSDKSYDELFEMPESDIDGLLLA